MIDPPDEELGDWIEQICSAAEREPITVREYSYGPGAQHRADLRLPAGPGPHPLIVVIHGGAFREQFTKRIMMANVVDLTLRGYATWNIEYRRSDCGGGPVTTPADVAAAIDFLGGLDADLDLDRMVVLGHSAGGYLALRAASFPTVTRVVALGSVCNFDLLDAEALPQYRQFAGGSRSEVPEAYRQLHLPGYFPTGARQVVLCGLDDEELRLRENRQYVAAAREAGEDVTYEELAGTGHFAFMDASTEAWQRTVDVIEEMLRDRTRDTARFRIVELSSGDAAADGAR